MHRSLRLVTIGGCLCMIYVAGTTSPIFVEFMRSLGATEAQFGVLGGIPMAMVSLQFLGAVITNLVRRRKPTFMALVILGRFLYIPIALVPLLFPSLRGQQAVRLILALVALSGALVNVTGPLWLSWMADLIPRRVLNTYWGQRQKWLFITWTASFLCVAAYTSLVTLPVRIAFPCLATVAAAAGIADILMFIGVREPRNVTMRGIPILDIVTAPVRNPQYRPFLLFSCAWSAVAMFSAAFMQVYVLKVLNLPLWQATLVWSVIGVGIAMVSPTWGRMADRHGHRPILSVCMSLKSLIVLAFLLSTSENALWILPPVLLVDSFLEAGLLVASNGYMLKIAPQRNRSMFIAAITGLAGICGGLGAMAGGAFLSGMSGWSADLLGRSWNRYHLLFALNFFMRLGCIAPALRIHDPKSLSPEKLLNLLWGAWPMRFLAFPVGLYRLLGGGGESMTGGDPVAQKAGSSAESMGDGRDINTQ